MAALRGHKRQGGLCLWASERHRQVPQKFLAPQTPSWGHEKGNRTPHPTGPFWGDLMDEQEPEAP